MVPDFSKEIQDAFTQIMNSVNKAINKSIMDYLGAHPNHTINDMETQYYQFPPEGKPMSAVLYKNEVVVELYFTHDINSLYEVWEVWKYGKRL